MHRLPRPGGWRHRQDQRLLVVRLLEFVSHPTLAEAVTCWLLSYTRSAVLATRPDATDSRIAF